MSSVDRLECYESRKDKCNYDCSRNKAGHEYVPSLLVEDVRESGHLTVQSVDELHVVIFVSSR